MRGELDPGLSRWYSRPGLSPWFCWFGISLAHLHQRAGRWWFARPGIAGPRPATDLSGTVQERPSGQGLSPADTLCCWCHAKEAKAFSHHPMARTLMPIDQVASLPSALIRHSKFSGNVFKSCQKMERCGIRARRATTRAIRFSSNNWRFSSRSAQARTLIRSCQSTDPRFSSKRRSLGSWRKRKSWDLSPEFHWRFRQAAPWRVPFLPQQQRRHYHATNELTVLQPAFPNGHGIGCQRCHGPGGEHVKSPGFTVKTATARKHGREPIINPLASFTRRP